MPLSSEKKKNYIQHKQKTQSASKSTSTEKDEITHCLFNSLLILSSLFKEVNKVG